MSECLVHTHSGGVEVTHVWPFAGTRIGPIPEGTPCACGLAKWPAPTTSPDQHDRFCFKKLADPDCACGFDARRRASVPQSVVDVSGSHEAGAP